MIRNAVVHINNEQPLLADLFEMPQALDQGLLCTNLRTLDGKRPVFVDKIENVFYFPYLHIRFVEFAATSSGLPELEAGIGANEPPAAEDAGDADADIELDEDFLRRIREV
jgi:hypothetical protein